MKMILKTAGLLLFALTVNICSAQTSPTSNGVKQQVKKDDSQKGKSKKVVDNKIAVSDQARPSDKSSMKGAKKSNGISNK